MINFLKHKKTNSFNFFTNKNRFEFEISMAINMMIKLQNLSKCWIFILFAPETYFLSWECNTIQSLYIYLTFSIFINIGFSILKYIQICFFWVFYIYKICQLKIHTEKYIYFLNSTFQIIGCGNKQSNTRALGRQPSFTQL